jgi:Divergent InlB B-repeat domain
MSDLGDFLKRGVGDFDASPEASYDLTLQRVQRRTRRRMVLTGAATFGVIAAMVGGLWWTLVPSPGGRPVAGPTPLSATPTPIGRPERVGPTVTFAAGRTGGERWVFQGYAAEFRTSDGRPVPAVCLSLAFASDDPDHGLSCQEVPAEPTQEPVTTAWSNFRRSGAPTVTAVWGTIRSQTARLEVRREDGGVTTARLFGGVAEIGAGLQPFLAFHPPDMSLTLAGLDGSGGVLWKKHLPAHHSSLTVATAGSGEGRIVGYLEREFNDLEPEEPKPIIECGTDCTVRLEYYTEVRLTAVPAPGSQFVRWTGQCADESETCIFSIKDDTEVTAVFEPAT